MIRQNNTYQNTWTKEFYFWEGNKRPHLQRKRKFKRFSVYKFITYIYKYRDFSAAVKKRVMNLEFFYLFQK